MFLEYLKVQILRILFLTANMVVPSAEPQLGTALRMPKLEL